MTGRLAAAAAAAIATLTAGAAAPATAATTDVLGLHSRAGLPLSKLRLTARALRSSLNARITFSGSITTTRRTTVVVYANAGSAFSSPGATTLIYHFSPTFQQKKLSLKKGTRRVNFTLIAKNVRNVPGTAALATARTDVVAVGVQPTGGGPQISGAPTLLQLSVTDPNTGAHR